MSGATATRATGCSWRRSSGSSAPAGAPWRDLPERFGDWKNTHKRFSRWAESGVWESLFKTLADDPRSEEHTSELQSRQYLVCRLLLEKKKNKMIRTDDMSSGPPTLS